MGRKLRLAIAGILIVYSHVQLEAGSELTELESNRDEWEWNVAIPPAATFERCVFRRKADVTIFTGASKKGTASNAADVINIADEIDCGIIQNLAYSLPRVLFKKVVALTYAAENFVFAGLAHCGAAAQKFAFLNFFNNFYYFIFFAFYYMPYLRRISASSSREMSSRFQLRRFKL